MHNLLETATLIEDEEGQIVVFPESIQFDTEEVTLIKVGNVVIMAPLSQTATNSQPPTEPESHP